jgi:hypothetical protein
VCSYSNPPQVTKELQRCGTIQSESREGVRHTICPSTGLHNLTVEMKLKEEFVDQEMEICAVKKLESDWNLDRGCIHIKLEDD